MEDSVWLPSGCCSQLSGEWFSHSELATESNLTLEQILSSLIRLDVTFISGKVEELDTSSKIFVRGNFMIRLVVGSGVYFYQLHLSRSHNKDASFLSKRRLGTQIFNENNMLQCGPVLS